MEQLTLGEIRWRRLVVQVSLVAAAWTAVLLAAAVWWAGGSAWDILDSIGWELWLAAVGLFALNHLLRFLRWHWMLVEEGYAIPAAKSLSIFLAGLALLPTPGKAGVAVRSLLLLREGVPVNVSLAAYFAERLFDLLGLVVLASLLLGGGAERRWIAALCGGLAVIVAVRLAPRLCRSLIRRRRGGERFQRAMAWALQFLEHAAELVAGRLFLPYLVLGAAANAATGVLLWLALSRFGVTVAVEQATGMVALSHLSGSLSLLPGGLGGFELAMLNQLSALGASVGSSFSILALVRFATIWGSVAVGLPLLLVLMRKSGIGDS